MNTQDKIKYVCLKSGRPKKYMTEEEKKESKRINALKSYYRKKAIEQFLKENDIKDAFNKNDKCRKVPELGNEFYEVDDLNVVYDTFLDMDLLGLNLEVPRIYEEGEFSIGEI